MAKKIALIGLYSIPNIGDKILCEAAEFLTHDIDASLTTIPVDACPRFPEDYHGLDYIKYRISRKMKTIAEKKFSYDNETPFRYRYEYFMWWLRLNRYYKKALRDVDAILFTGGGFLKFRTQGLNYYVEQIIKIAERRNIPVMMNGVGIEGYSKTDIRCQKLKKVINSNCVKTITTRDDIETLQHSYVTSPSIETALVGDVALWTPECYGVSRDRDAKTIGINAIRGQVFVDYGNKHTHDELKVFYLKMLKEIERRGLRWKFFSNGMQSDQEFALEVLDELGLSPEEYLLPRPETSEELLGFITNFSCIFGARLHACITAYSLDVPVTAFIWNEKIRIFAQLIDKKENFFEESQMEDVSAIVDCLEKSRGSSYDSSIRDNLKALTRDYLQRFVAQI